MFRPEQQIGQYVLIHRLGRGGFGEVWLAERRAKFVTTKVAVKLPLEAQVDHQAIKSEAVLWEQASGHPNILPIIEADEYDGQIVIVSEYAPDGSLEDLLKQTAALPIKRAVELTNGILSGLEFLHNRKIIHRDIKPANILLQGDTPRLTDFGISRVLKTTNVSVNMSGTPSYMAPEAFDRKRTIQTDIWSVGVILYQMLKGALPFPHENMTDLLGAVIMGVPEPLPGTVPPRLREIVFKALAKKPEERYSSSREMREDLADFLVRDSQSNIQTILITEEKTKVLPANPLAETQASPTIRSPFAVSATKGQSAETQASNEIFEIPQIQSQKPKKNSRYLKIFAPLVTLVLAFIIGGYFLNKNFSATTLPQNSAVASNEVQLIPFRKGSKFGFCDKNKNSVLEAKYDSARPFKESRAIVEIDGKFGVIDETGREVISIKYDGLDDFSEGLGKAKLNKKEGFIDKNGNEVISLKYDMSGEFSEGLAGVCIDKKCGYIDKNGNEIIPFIYDSVGSFHEDLASAAQDNKMGFIDKTGKVVIPFKYNFAGSFSDGLAYISNSDGKTFFINKNGTPIIEPGAFLGFSEGLSAVWFSKDGKSEGYFIDKQGQRVSFPKFDDVRSFSEGLAGVQIKDKWGYIDKTGKEAIPLKYDTVGGFKNDLALVERGTLTFYIDKNGTEYYDPNATIQKQNRDASADKGKILFEEQMGCASCHGAASQQRGNTLTGLFGKKVKLADGQTVEANELYIRNSIVNPASQIVEGYQPIMPTFKGQLTDEQLADLVEYIKSLTAETK